MTNSDEIVEAEFGVSGFSRWAEEMSEYSVIFAK